MDANKKAVIFLGGGGGSKASAELDTIFFSLLKKDARILYIPTALDPERYPGAVEWFTKVIRLYSDTIDFTMMTEDNVNQFNFDDFDAVYIGGGNTYKLLDFIISNNLDQKLRAFIDSGKLFYGGSAGAILTGKTINTAAEMDPRLSYKYDNGLNWLKDASVSCHWPETKHCTDELLENNPQKIYCIPENCGLLFDVKGDLLRTVGSGVEIL